MKPKLVIILICTLFISLAGCQDGDGDTTCTVTYSSGTGSTSGTVPEDSTVYNSGAEVTIMNNTGNLTGPLVGGEHDGSGIKQRFLEWNTSSEGTGTFYSPGDTFNITETVTLHAVYTTGTDVLRKVGPAGGWIFYDAESTETWGRYLEAAPYGWYDAGDDPGVYWGALSTATGITDTAIGTGKDNTALLVTWLAANSETGRAAQLCQASTAGGCNDWFLPSSDELYYLRKNLYNEGNTAYTALGGFSEYYYWSSSEYDASYTRNLIFGQASTGWGTKANPTRVRPVRAF